MVKRVFQMVVLFFAIYAFVFVPLGRKTALEHLRAIAGTSAAKEAASELKGGVTRLAHELREQAQRSTEATDEQIAGTDAPVPTEEPQRAKATGPAKAKLLESANGSQRHEATRSPLRGPQRIPSREPAAASTTLDPARLDLSGLEQPPDLKELRSLGSGR
jgi:hypothetical protein